MAETNNTIEERLNRYMELFRQTPMPTEPDQHGDEMLSARMACFIPPEQRKPAENREQGEDETTA